MILHYHRKSITPAFSKLPIDMKLSIIQNFLFTKELGKLARVNNELKAIITQCDNKEYLALTKGQKIVNVAKNDLKKNEVLKLLTLNDLESHYGLLILGEGLLTLEIIKQLKLDPVLKIICTQYGFAALREKLITLPQIQSIGGIRLRDILTESGLFALRKNLISPEKIIELNINTFILECLLSEKGIYALKNRVITIEQAVALDILDLKDMVANVNLSVGISV